MLYEFNTDQMLTGGKTTIPTVSPSNSSGASGAGMLGVLFVGLKLTGVIGWSWWYVTLPFWGGAALVVVCFSAFLLVEGIGECMKSMGWRKKKKMLLAERKMKEVEILDKIVEERKLASQLECPYMQEALAEVERICS